jgi:hypothetical protein
MKKSTIFIFGEMIVILVLGILLIKNTQTIVI